MGGAFLLRRGDGYVCFFYYYQWRESEQWHVINVFEAVAGLALLVAGHGIFYHQGTQVVEKSSNPTWVGALSVLHLYF